MVGDGVVGETQLLADLLARQVLADQQQDFTLPRRQALELAILAVVVPVHAIEPDVITDRAPAGRRFRDRSQTPLAATITQFSFRPRMIFLDGSSRS